MPPDRVAGSGLEEVIRQAVPRWLVPAVIAIARLGSVVSRWHRSPSTIGSVTTGRGAHALGPALAGMARITVFKPFFAHPRPPRGFASSRPAAS